MALRPKQTLEPSTTTLGVTESPQQTTFGCCNPCLARLQLGRSRCSMGLGALVHELLVPAVVSQSDRCGPFAGQDSSDPEELGCDRPPAGLIRSFADRLTSVAHLSILVR